MALASKQSEPFYLTTGGGGDEINAARKTVLTNAFTSDKTRGNVQLINDNTLGPVIFNIQRMQDDLDELRRFVASSSEARVGTTFDASTDFTVGSTVILDDRIQFTPSTDDTATITASANGTLDIVTNDTAAAAANITIEADGTSELAGTTVTLDSAGDIELEVGAATNYVQTAGVFRGGNIGCINDTMLPVTITEFTLSDSSSGDHVYVTTNTRFGYCTDIAQLYYAVVVIPNGYTASACIVHGADLSRSSTFTCYQGDLTGSAPSSIGTTTFGRTIAFSSNIVGNGIKTCIIELNWNHAGDFITGAAITLAKT